MAKTPQLTDVLLHWQELQKQGRTVSVEELCADCPELVAELRKRIKTVEAFLGLPPERSGTEGPAVDGLEAKTPQPRTTALDGAGIESPPAQIAGYEILDELGRGGMGVVYKARHLGLDRIVALKVILAGRHAGAENRARFQAEARAVAQLKHPHIVQVYDTGEQDGLSFFTMELVEGGNLEDRLQKGPLPQLEAADLLRTLALALQTAHDKGIIHRDLKPANVLLTSNGIPQITDFGLVKHLDGPKGLTVTGQVLGTAGYMAPEQAGGRSAEIGPATDVYGLGVLLYQSLTGRVPFPADNLADTLVQVLRAEPAPPSRWQPGLSRDLEAVCLKCLAKEPALRYASARAVAEDLERWLHGEPTQARPRSWPSRLGHGLRRRPRTVAAVLGLVVLLAGLFLAVHYRDPDRPVRAMQQELAAGKAVTLVGADGAVRWSSWPGAHGGIKEPGAKAEGLTLHCFTPTLLELLPDPKIDRFRLRCQFRHEEGRLGHEAGIYFGRNRYPLGTGEVVYFFRLAFNDLNPLPPAPTNPPGNPLQLRIGGWRPAEGPAPGPQVLFNVHLSKPAYFPTGGQALTPGPWRSLAVEVTPERLRLFWEGALVRDVAVQDAAGSFGRYLSITPAMANAGVDFRLSGGLGLLLDEGMATFRDVVIEPLPPNK